MLTAGLPHLFSCLKDGERCAYALLSKTKYAKTFRTPLEKFDYVELQLMDEIREAMKVSNKSCGCHTCKFAWLLAFMCLGPSEMCALKY